MLHRATRLLICASMLAGAMLVADTVDPLTSRLRGPSAEVAALGDANVVFDRPGNPVTFGPNELVEIYAGNINFVGSPKVWSKGAAVCSLIPGGTAARPTPGLDDAFQPFADIYIVPAGSTFTNNAKVRDVAGAPNTVAGGLGGSFLFEGLAITKPEGRLGAGTYGIVIDECQNGVFDTGEDTFIDHAFRVDLQQDVPPLSPQAAEFAALKASAQRTATTMSSIEELALLIQIQDAYDKASGALDALASPKDAISFLFDQAIAPFKEQLPNEVVKARMRAIHTQAVRQHKIAARRLAADPPQTDFAHFAVPATLGAGFNESPFDLGAAYAAFVAEEDTLRAITTALVDAIERYQGADLVGDAQWALRHARTIEELASLYVAALPNAQTAATAFDAEVTGLSGQPWAQFINANRVVEYVTGSLRSADLEREADPLNTGRTPDEIRSVIDDTDDVILRSVAFPDTPQEWTPRIDAIMADHADFAASVNDMSTLAASVQPTLVSELADEAADPEIGISVTGSPMAGATVQVGITGATAASTVDWDLDGDGEFDDAIGTTADWAVPGDLLTGSSRLLAARVSGDVGTDVAFELVIIAAGGNRAPQIPEHADGFINLAPGDSHAFIVAATDPDGDTLTYEWLVGGEIQPGATGTTFTLDTAADRLDSYFVEALVSDGSALTRTGWFVRTVTPDGDNDGFMAAPGPDCNDGNVSIHPNRDEFINGIDDDCNGIVDDVSPGYAGFDLRLVGTIEQTVDGLATEGTQIRLRSAWNHANRSSGDDYLLTVDWQDGTVDTQVVSYTPGSAIPSNGLEPEFLHEYGDQFRDRRIEFCWEWLDDPAPDPQTGNASECFARKYTILNDRPIVNATDFRTWDPVQLGGPFSGSYSGDWFDADPSGKALHSSLNPNNYVVRTSTDLLGVNGYGRVALNHEVSGGDDDEIGILFGYDPTFDIGDGGDPEGEFFDPNSDIIGFTWYNTNGSMRREFRASDHCDGPTAGTLYEGKPDHATIWRHLGQPSRAEKEYMRTFDYPGSTQPECTDGAANGYQVLASVDRNLDQHEFVMAGWWGTRALERTDSVTNSPDPRLVEIDYQPRSITVYGDGVQQMRYDVPNGEPDLPPSTMSIFYESQANAVVSAADVTPVFPFVQGRGGEFDHVDTSGDPVSPDGISIRMHDGADDTHEARISWGDGETTTEGIVAADPTMGPGWFTISGSHVYERAGTFIGETCVADDEGLSMCAPFVAEVANVAPVVHAGPDIAVGADVTLDDMTFQDPGPFDTHTVTIDWGDGPSDAGTTVDATRGGGTITATHTFTTDGPTTVEVCVTDQHGDTGCDSRILDVRITDVAPEAALPQIAETVEGADTVVGIGWTDANVDETHTVTIDWGDGTSPEIVPVDQSFVGCTDLDDDPNIIDAHCALTAQSAPSHTYTDNGTFTVTAEVCDSDDECDTVTTTMTVTNVAPVVDASASTTGRAATVTGTYSDAGAADTHRVTIDWGDATTPTNQAVAGGVFNVTHTYARNGERTIEVCVTDDDDATDCQTVSGAPKIPFIVPLTPARLLDTRTPAEGGATDDGLFLAAGKQDAKTFVELDVLTRGGIPASGVDAVVLNLTATAADVGGYATAYPCGDKPNASSLNYQQSDNANEVIAKLSPAGTVCIYTNTRTHIIADTVGYIPTGSDYHPLTPARLLDTRTPAEHGATDDGLFLATGKQDAKTFVELDVLTRGGIPATGVDAVVLNLTATNADVGGYATAYPCGTRPNASSLNYQHTDNANEVIAKLSPNGTVCIYTNTRTHIIADTVGYIPTGSDYHPLTPARLLDTRTPAEHGATDDGLFLATGKQDAKTFVELDVLTRGGIPATGVDAVVLNLTATNADVGGYATAYPCGTRPNASSLNYQHTDNANEVIAKLSPNGTVCIYTNTRTHIIADTVGYITG